MRLANEKNATVRIGEARLATRSVTERCLALGRSSGRARSVTEGVPGHV